MAVTRNGWTTAPVSRVAITSPSTKDTGEVRAGAVATIFQDFVLEYNRVVETVTTINGYRSPALNKQVGGDPNSNHLSATALDINGAKHPYEANLPASQRGKNYKHGFSSQQVSAIRKLLARYDGVLYWGLDFNTGYRDAMHFEIRGSASKVAQVANKIGSDDVISDADLVNISRAVWGQLYGRTDKSMHSVIGEIHSNIGNSFGNLKVARGTAKIAALQELADAKTIAMELKTRLVVLQSTVEALSEVQKNMAIAIAKISGEQGEPFDEQKLLDSITAIATRAEQAVRNALAENAEFDVNVTVTPRDSE